MIKYPRVVGFVLSLIVFWFTVYIDEGDGVQELVISMLNGIAVATILGMLYELYSKLDNKLISAHMLIGGLMSSSISYIIIYFYRIYTHAIQFNT